ncbi:Slam-dependent surface lipoprotein [Acinetobacter gerneri]|uniref:Slam-dependent surface lipoprotein n=1 Tax=Acinetobacter gerneri TaxID=202952 RepID=A0AAW8JPM8_9GAMM|nr:Slam-dependent surface lipoprotein [Acinetobacter gerneri]MDQ9010728.1 Slam-dependent surface lipoprotein [Acinetobacter gerneri]MDQ9014446.1 Slam-dependent surface lipoprotein [Acinetobacter gerneri]MDQ9025617.1 Slam-dependent surface lipoprotein [Acinetobacter gerneri]MDQ9052898.1 Slam-dependent surface lipoprotein [Acinetobacter gerneri]MDQ9060499.1 Slam-dependent surface lipoprotein [Acinetobacter gerneri]
MKLKQISCAVIATFGVIGSAHAAIGGEKSQSFGLILSDTAVAVGVQGSFGNAPMDFSHLKAFGANANGVYHFAGSDIPVSSHQGLGVWDFKQVGAKDIYFGEWAKEGQDSAGNYTKQADSATHTVFYIGNNADSSITSTGSATYTVSGLNGGNYYAGSYNANFATSTLTGSLSNGTDTFNLGTASIGSDAKINGNNASWSGANLNATAGKVSGQFFNSQQDLAGIASFADSKNDIAFGGSK